MVTPPSQYPPIWEACGRGNPVNPPSGLKLSLLRAIPPRLAGSFLPEEQGLAVALGVLGTVICRHCKCGKSRQRACGRDRAAPHEQPAALGLLPSDVSPSFKFQA